MAVCETTDADEQVAAVGGGQADAQAVVVRRYPWPYRAMLAICSDLDRTPDAETYHEIARYLNTRENTRMGPGAGLEVGNSIYFDMPSDQFSYWGTDDRGRAMIQALIGSGHVDCLHSYGDLARERAAAERAVGELEKRGCRLAVWVDHSKAPTNFGPDIMVGEGDVPGSAAYHADVTLGYGIRYVWRGRTTGVNGQEFPADLRALRGMLNIRHPAASLRTAAKEAMKVRLGRRGDARWAMYGANRVCRASTLRDGQRVWEFMRFNPFWGGSGEGGTNRRFADTVTRRTIGQFVAREAAGILYTHLGDLGGAGRSFGARMRRSFQELAAARDRRELFVTTTHRLLRYLTVRDGLRCRVGRTGNCFQVTVEEVADPVCGRRLPAAEDLEGLTFMVPRWGRLEVRQADEEPVALDVQRHGAWTYGVVRWRPLVFPTI